MKTNYHDASESLERQLHFEVFRLMLEQHLVGVAVVP